MGDKFVRISQLPESSQFSPSDYLVVENDQDTWKVKMSNFDKYIKDKVDVYEQTIVNSVDIKVNQIQTIVTETEQIITNINIKLIEFSNDETNRNNAERVREQNEAIRQRNEVDRVATANQSSINEQGRKDAEDARVAAENARISAENTRKADETDRINKESIRQQNETVRQSAEATRNTNEANRQANENTRQTGESDRQVNETDRINRFNEMEDIIDNFNTFLQNNSKEGISKIDEKSGYLPILEIALPKDHIDFTDDEQISSKKYAALIYICSSIFTAKTNINTSLDNEYPEYKPGGVLISMEIYLERSKLTGKKELTAFISSIPNIYDTLFFNEMLNVKNSYVLNKGISLYYKMNNDSLIITVYMGLPTGLQYHSVSTSILWDNILEFKSDDTKYYSKSLSNQSLKHGMSYNPSPTGPFLAEITYKVEYAGDKNNSNYSAHPVDSFVIDNMPRGIIDILHSIGLYSKRLTKEMIKNEKYKFYPVGSIYISTSSINPGTVVNQNGSTVTGALGGGTWELINNDGFNIEFVNILKGTPDSGNVAGTPDHMTMVTETIYIWKRIE